MKSLNSSGTKYFLTSRKVLILDYYHQKLIQYYLNKQIMKKTLIIFATAAILAGGLLSSCTNNEEKVDEAVEEKVEADMNLENAVQVQSEEFVAFKSDVNVKIAEDEKRIAELKAKLAKSGEKPMDDMRRKRIEELEISIAELKTRLNDYEKTPSDWEAFKTEFKHDMDAIGDGFKELGNDSKK